MAYDHDLADRIRVLLAATPAVSEQPMFGGLSFLVSGHLAVAASSWGGILVRVGAETADELATSTSATVPDMGGRTMRGWLHVDGSELASSDSLRPWVERGLAFVETLPPK